MTLEQAIAQLYQAFSIYSHPEQMDACPCCVNQEDKDHLGKNNLHDLTADQLGKYTSKAMTTWGDIEDYKHFLPRILELATAKEGEAWPGMEFWMIAGKLDYGEWRTWPVNEQNAIIEYLRAL